MGLEMPEWVQSLLAALGGLGLGGYTVHRKLKADRTSDTLDAKSQAIIERLEEQLANERKNNLQMGEVIDRVAKERNDAVQQVGRLEGTVHALQGEVERMRNEVVRLEKKNAELTHQITGLNETVRNMSDRINVMLLRFEQRTEA